MKPCKVKLLLLLLIFALCLPTLAGCSGKHGETLLSIEDTTLSVNTYELLLSRMKGTLAKYQYDVDSDAFWSTVVDMENSTYDEYFRATILENAKTYVIGTYLFDEVYGLTLSKETTDAIDEELAEFVDYDGDGSKTAFNRILAEYGVNYDILRDTYIMEAKIDALKLHLYGESASKIADNVKEEYCQENFVRFKQVFLASYYYVCETDENGDNIYYTTNSLGNKVVCYDKENGSTKTDENGYVIKDKDGYDVYFTEDGKIAYDKETGTTSYIINKDGEPEVGDYTKEQLAEIKQNAKDILAQISEGDYDTFELLMEKHGEDEDAQTYENGYYLHKDPANYESYPYLESIVKQLNTLEAGQTALVESDYGYHIVMKYPIEEGAWDDEDNKDWFEGFEEGLIDDLFMKLCEQYVDKVEIDQDVLDTVPSMKQIGINFYY
ncbi:MAG: peptidylprolyl isomerase [Clostridia bacterium]|nr:peptidylprolyl isomerase [Clostridia bacterium]